MKVNLVSYLDPEAYSGGGELVVRELLAEGRRRGFRFRISSVRWGKVSKLLGPRIRTFSRPDIWLLVDLWNCPEEGRGFPAGFLEVILENERYVCLDNAWTSICWRPEFPCMGIRESCPDACGHERARQLYARAGLVVFLSPVHQRAAENLIGGRIGAAFAVPPTFDRRRFANRGGTRDIPYLYVGTIAEYKGALEVESRFGESGIVWAGRNALGRPVKGRELGVVSGDDLVDLYNRARCFVHLPRWLEPMGRAVVEAALCGCELLVNERVGALSWGRTEEDFRRLPEGAGLFWDQVTSAVSGG